MSMPELPALLKRDDGSLVTTAAQWQERRRELLELFRTHVYGRVPQAAVVRPAFDVRQAPAMEGRAIYKAVRIAYTGAGGRGGIHLHLYVPAQRSGPVPLFMLGSNRAALVTGNAVDTRSGFWPAETIVARGYAAAMFRFLDVDPDEHDGFRNGVHGIFDAAQEPRPGDAWGTIAAWAWGFSRAMDYLETDPDVDPKRVSIVGHSRGGKTALWAGAQDQRFAMVVSNNSGCTGAALARGKQGERIADITQRFPHWFCANYATYSNREGDLPVDQHMLLALIAPRLLYVTSATEDAWADPVSEWRSAVAARPAWELHEAVGLTTSQQPVAETPLHDGRIGYHLRTGKHGLTDYDWKQFMLFADRHLRG